jgi:hypothetical protein
MASETGKDSDTVQQKTAARSNIAWYLPKAYAAKLLPIFADIDQWYYLQAQSEAHTDGSQTNAQQGRHGVLPEQSAAPSGDGGKQQ